ncbi:hypothetical protein BWQ96_08275 [Gracilariopsis chorda]|uniref:Uncharacterized protein n=1 Tax=Gracilariopsis chorda TaxID=448386 RepID=A0A2V3IIU5_9FLOR|nr:hypothetical protein BWQ96_08275 [Gracilariopsis chorda]|eukprot:PXF41968.1 hypothetical protein BWQ96_08275 [Gracilariopsis chorda]
MPQARPIQRSHIPFPHFPTQHEPDCIDFLVHRLALPDHLATLAHYIHNTALPTASDPYTAACALYVASIAFRADQIPQLPLSRLLGAASSDRIPLRITTHFTHNPTMVVDSERHSPTSPQHLTPPSTPPEAPLVRRVHLSHTAFMVSAHVWRKLRYLIDRNLLVNHPSVPRLPWLFFIVAKATISSPTDCNLTHVQAYHLLLACLLQSGFIEAPDPERALFRVTCVVPSELQHYKRALDDLLHKCIRTRLPFLPHSDQVLQQICQQLDHAYDAQLTNVKHRLATDERIFLHAPNLAAVGSPPISPVFSASPLNQQPSASTTPGGATKRPSDGSNDDTTPPPNRRPRLLTTNSSHPSSARPPTPARRPRSASHTPMSTPTRFSRYAASTRADALDALATVAAVTPHSAASLPATPPPQPFP